jgi:hypothetical protein
LIVEEDAPDDWRVMLIVSNPHQALLREDDYARVACLP